MLLSTPSTYMMKSFEISRFLSNGGYVIYFLISLKASFASFDLENISYFFSIEVIGDTISKKSLMNFLTILI